MDDVFLVKLFISFIVGGIWTVLATVLADKYGSKAGGVIAGLPSTGLFSLVFIAWTQDISSVTASTTMIPISVGVEMIFLVIYIYLVRRGFYLALIASFSVWFLLASLLFFSGFNNYLGSIVVYFITLLICGYIAEKVIRTRSIAKGQKIVYSNKIFIYRGLLGGFIVSLIVVLSKLISPSLGGIFTGFPAMILSIILITYFTQGAEFSAATMKSSVFSLSSLVLYSVLVRYSYGPFGIVVGTLLSVAITFIYAYLFYKYITPHLK